MFEAQRGISSSCDSALDNIVITDGPCPCEFARTHTHTHTQRLIAVSLTAYMFCPQLVFLAVVLTLWTTFVAGRLTLRVLMCLALASGLGQQKRKALVLIMTSPNLEVSGNLFHCFFFFFIFQVWKWLCHRISQSGAFMYKRQHKIQNESEDMMRLQIKKCYIVLYAWIWHCSVVVQKNLPVHFVSRQDNKSSLSPWKLINWDFYFYLNTI